MDWLSGLVNGIGGIIGRIFGSKENREKIEGQLKHDVSSEFQINQEAIIAELKASARRTDFFTVFVDGINRLVRPIYSYGVVAFFVWVVVDPVGFTVSMAALELVPNFMYGIFLTIVTFWFGGRILERYADRKLEGPTSKQLQDVLASQKEIQRQNGRLIEKTEENVATAISVAQPNPVVNQIVKGKYTMEPVYEEDEQHLKPTK